MYQSLTRGVLEHDWALAVLLDASCGYSSSCMRDRKHGRYWIHVVTRREPDIDVFRIGRPSGRRRRRRSTREGAGGRFLEVKDILIHTKCILTRI